MWLSGNGDRVGDVGITVKEELCRNLVDVRKVKERVVVYVLIFEEDVLRIILLHALSRRRRLK